MFYVPDWLQDGHFTIWTKMGWARTANLNNHMFPMVQISKLELSWEAPDTHLVMAGIWRRNFLTQKTWNRKFRSSRNLQAEIFCFKQKISAKTENFCLKQKISVWNRKFLSKQKISVKTENFCQNRKVDEKALLINSKVSLVFKVHTYYYFLRSVKNSALIFFCNFTFY